MNLNEFTSLIKINSENNKQQYIKKLTEESQSFYHSYTGINYRDNFMEKSDFIEFFAAVDAIKTIREDVPEFNTNIEQPSFKKHNLVVKEYYRNIKQQQFLLLERKIEQQWKRAFIKLLKNKCYENILSYPKLNDFAKDYISYHILNNIVFSLEHLKEDKENFSEIERNIINKFGINTDLNSIHFSFKDFSWNYTPININKNLISITSKLNIAKTVSKFNELIHLSKY